MDRVRELLARITELSDDELTELKDLVLQEFDGQSTDDSADTADPAAGGDPSATPSDSEMSFLEELAEAAQAVRNEFAARDEKKKNKASAMSALNSLRDGGEEFATGTGTGTGGGASKNADKNNPKKKSTSGGSSSGSYATTTPPGSGPSSGSSSSSGTDPKKKKPTGSSGSSGSGSSSSMSVEDGPEFAASDPEVPEGYEPEERRVSRTTVTAGADLPGIAMGREFTSMREVSDAFVRRIGSMRGIRGGDGDKMLVASAQLQSMPDSLKLLANDAEGNLAKMRAVTSPQAVTAAGGLVAPEESKYDLFGEPSTDDRPVRSALPVFQSDRGGVRFIRPPTLNDLNGAVGIWTVQDDIEAVDNPNVRKPAFRVEAGPEIVVDTQAITMILTFGNLVSRAYPELVARHNELALVAQARVAEQQSLTQIGALSTHVTGRTQRLGAVRELLSQVAQASASYKNRHRTGDTPLQAIMPVWLLDILRADIYMQHPGDGLEIFAITVQQIESWFRAQNINIAWALDGEAGQDYDALATGQIAKFKTEVIWYLFVDGTFSFMDNGTLDLGLVRDSTLNSANDYQMFVETFENIVKFGNESLRVSSTIEPIGTGTADVALALRQP